jgi:hypothetical protein
MTKKGNPSTDAKTLSSLAANIENKKSIKYRIVNSLLELSKIEKILNIFIRRDKTFFNEFCVSTIRRNCLQINCTTCT